MELCRCGHLIKHHSIMIGSIRRVESCRADETGLFDKCKCNEVRPISNFKYLEEMYNVRSR